MCWEQKATRGLRTLYNYRPLELSVSSFVFTAVLTNITRIDPPTTSVRCTDTVKDSVEKP